MSRNGMRNASVTLRKYWVFYAMLLPVVAYFLVFSFYPMILGIQSSFMDVKLMSASKFIGWKNYQEILASPMYTQALVNTLIVGLGSFLLEFFSGLVLALMLNEVRSKFFKSLVQSFSYLPDLLSWAIVGSMWLQILSATGMVNGFLSLIFGPAYKPVVFMAEERFARGIMILTSGWKITGYFAVLFLAAIVSIDGSIYEAAAIDGASRMRQLYLITIPNIVPTMKTLAVLGSMSVLRNFDQIFVMNNANILSAVRNLLYLIFIDGLTKFKIGPATAAATLVLLTTLLLTTVVRRLVRYDRTYE